MSAVLLMMALGGVVGLIIDRAEDRVKVHGDAEMESWRRLMREIDGHE